MEPENEDKPKEKFLKGLNTWRLAALVFFAGEIKRGIIPSHVYVYCKHIHTLPLLTFLLNYNSKKSLTPSPVSGGPYGSEELVKSGGPLLSIVGLLVSPWIWGLPMALLTAELGSAIPEMGGYIVWSKRAFGDFFALQTGVYNVFCNALDNALYPILFIDYLKDVLKEGAITYELRVLITVAVVVVIGSVNILGVDVVGDGATVFGFMVLLPFLILIFYGLFDSAQAGGDLDHWGDVLPSPKYGTFVTLLLWNTSGYDSAGKK